MGFLTREFCFFDAQNVLDANSEGDTRNYIRTDNKTNDTLSASCDIFCFFVCAKCSGLTTDANSGRDTINYIKTRNENELYLYRVISFVFLMRKTFWTNYGC